MRHPLLTVFISRISAGIYRLRFLQSFKCGVPSMPPVNRFHFWPAILLLLSLLNWQCTKDQTVLIPDNDAPLYNRVPSIRIENYVNRLFIDLIGREPLDEEMDREVQALKAAQLSTDAREVLIIKLQTGADFVPGDTSYAHAYYRHLYNLAKARCLEGISDERIVNEFLNISDDEGDSLRLQSVLHARQELEAGKIKMNEVFTRMVYNAVYDQINMNSFNFVNATFDNLLWRYPTKSEFKEGYNMVEYNLSGSVLGRKGQNKGDYVAIFNESRELFEGIIIWTYQQLLARRPTSKETAVLLKDFYDHRDIRLIQRAVLVTNEYANFE